MAESYVVNYDINVFAQDAIQALNNFRNAANNLSQIATKFQTLNKELTKLPKTPVLDINTTKINQKLDVTIAKLERLNALKKNANVTTGIGSAGGGGGGSGSSGSVGGGGSKSKGSFKAPKINTKASTYKVLGQSLVNTGGIGALDFMKGMGLAYGITALGSMVSKTVKDAVEYDNLMATTRNILGTHDPNKETFGARFASMEGIVRKVGVETKYTAPQVADAAKFLAMAGFDVGAINKSIAPIADIALVGDTELGETADVVTNIMTGYGIGPDRIRRAADVMAMTFTMSNTTLLEIAEAYKYSASLLSAAGVPFETSTAAMGILGNAGIKGSQAGTTLRTIMANLAKPTKQQAKHWDKLGISRTDAAGRVRPLNEIFQDLYNADLYVDDFYRLFHKTAAQGAVSLAYNVDRWNEIIEKNFLSDGLVSDLAKEKKNTLQGLWYQLTSAFTETGMKVFKESDNPIRQKLNSITKWLKGDGAKGVMRQVSEFAMTMLETLGGFSSTLMGIYEQFGGLITWWLKFQLYASAALIPLRGFKAIWEMGKWLKPGIGYIGTLTTKFQALSLSMLNATSYAKSYRRMMDRYVLTDGNGKIIRNWRGAQPYIASAGNIFGGIAGAMLGSKLGEEGSAASIAGAMGLGVAGSVGGGMLFNWLGGLAASAGAATLAIGAAAAAAVVGLVAVSVAVTRNAIATKNAAEWNGKYLDSLKSINGIDYSEYASMSDKYLQIVYNKQLDTNEAIAEHIELLKERLGLITDTANAEAKKEAYYSGDNKDYFDDLFKTFSFWNWFGAKRRSVALSGENMHPTKVGDDYELNGIVFEGGSGVSEYEELAIARRLATQGASLAEGSDLEKLKQHFNKLYFSQTTLEGFEAITSQVEAEISKRLKDIVPGTEKLNESDIKDEEFSIFKAQHSYHYTHAFVNKLRELFNYNDPQENANAEAIRIYKEIVEKYQAGALTKNHPILEAYLQASGVDIFNKDHYPFTFGSDEMMKAMGYDVENGTWLSDVVKTKDGAYLSDAQAQEHWLAWLDKILVATDILKPEIRDFFSDIIGHKAWKLVNKNDGKKKPKTKENSTYVDGDGTTWTYTNGQWISDDGEVMSATDAMAKFDFSKVKPPKKGNSADYESHYAQGSAAPKQVIVKIENLMNVQSVDLTNPDNAAAIADVKGQLAQALIDVVYDFDVTYNNG